MTVALDPISADFPARLYTCDQVRELDRLASQEGGVAPAVLMSRAGRALFRAIRRRWPKAESITVLCGGGNNAGDGYVIAALAAQKRIPVRVLWVVPPERLVGPARQAYEYALQEGVPVAPFDEQPHEGGLYVDALLGIGAQGEVRGPVAKAIEWLNQAEAPVVAVDIPSGLCGDTGRELGVAVRAQLTMTFIGCKQGLLTGRGPALTGELLFDNLGASKEVLVSAASSAQVCSLSRLLSLMPERPADAHKGWFGHLMVIGGDQGLGGAAIMAAEMAARAGVGLVSVATRAEHLPAVLARLPEAMAAGVASGQELEPYLARPQVLAVGPGLGRSPWSEQMLQQAARTGLPLVLDADGLNLLAEGRVLPKGCRDSWILTPHPGEAARLLGKTTADVQADRFAAVQALQERYGGVVVLKGAGTLIADGSGIWLSRFGNPGMATGGMGDILTGLIGALLAQGLQPAAAACLGVALHGAAADLAAAEKGQIGLLPNDLLVYIRRLLNAPVGDFE